MGATPAASGAAHAIVLAGGSARRLGGVDKLALVVGGMRLLDRVLTPLAELGWPTVVVGPRRAVAAGLPEPLWTRESPVGGGPATGLAAGLAALDADRVDHSGHGRAGSDPAAGAVRSPAGLVAVLAGDLPHLDPGVLATLARAAREEVAAGGAGALAVDDSGIDQLLLGVWAIAALRAATSGVLPGASLRSVLSPLRAVRVRLAGAPAPWSDCDTGIDLARARAELTPTAGR